MFFNDDYISCSECGHRVFESKRTFLIKKIVANTPRQEVSYVREHIETIKCVKCGSELDLE